MQLLAAVAAQRAEDVARDALRVHAHEHVLLAGQIAVHEREVLLAADELAVADRRELAPRRRQAHRGLALDEALGAAAVLDQVGDGAQLEAVLGAELHEIGHARHRPVGLHDLADHARRAHAGEPREIDRGLGLAGALEHAAGARAQREDVTGLDDVARAGGRRARHLDGVRAILRRDARLDALAGLDRDRERRLVGRLVVLHHHLQPELLAALGRERQADQPAAVRGHEVDRVGADVLRRHAQVALVLTVGRIDDHHHATGPDLLDRLLDAAEGRRLFAHAVPR